MGWKFSTLATAISDRFLSLLIVRFDYVFGVIIVHTNRLSGLLNCPLLRHQPQQMPTTRFDSVSGTQVTSFEFSACQIGAEVCFPYHVSRLASDRIKGDYP
jgi:hypothetical protein